MEIACEKLERSRLATEIGEVVKAIQQRTTGDLSVMYGFACTNDEKNQWTWIRVSVAGLSEFLADSSRKGIYEQGCADLYISVPSLAVDITLCHESDIHIKSEVNELLDFFRFRWLCQGMVSK